MKDNEEDNILCIRRELNTALQNGRKSVESNSGQRLPKGVRKYCLADLTKAQQGIFAQFCDRLKAKGLDKQDENLLLRCLIGRE